MSPVFIIGTLTLLTLMYWGAYRTGKEIKTIELSGNILLNVPEIILKLVLFGLCLGLASSLDPAVGRLENYFGWPSKAPFLEIAIGAAIGIALQFVVNVASTLAIRVWGSGIYSPVVIKSTIPKNFVQWLLTPFPLLLAVVLEEVLFRALAIGGFSALFPNFSWWAWTLAVISSVIFGLVHKPQGILGVILTGTIGFAFASIFLISNSLLMVIAAHFVINFLQIIRAREDLAWLERFQQQESLRKSQASAPVASPPIMVDPEKAESL